MSSARTTRRSTAAQRSASTADQSSTLPARRRRTAAERVGAVDDEQVDSRTRRRGRRAEPDSDGDAPMEQQRSDEGQRYASQGDADDSAPSDVDSDMVDESAQREAALRDQVATLQQLLGHLQQQKQQPQQQQQQSRFAKKEPRANDLREYEGDDGSKLDAWIDELGAVVGLFHLTDQETVEFGSSRLRGAARLWWKGLGTAGQSAIIDADALAAGLRSRFQPVTAAKVARSQLDRLQQGSRHVNDYISDFQRLQSQLPNMDEEDAIHAFERGLRPDLAAKLCEQAVETITSAIALAARVGAGNPHGRPAASANQMDGETNGTLAQMQEMMLNMMRMQQQQAATVAPNGSGSSTFSGQFQRRDGRGGRGGGGFGNRSAARQLPVIPGVSSSVIQQRWDGKMCLRCGAADHRAISCPNDIKAFGQGN